MKKGLCLFLCLAAVMLTLCSCKSVKNSDAVADLTYVDESGKTHLYATEENGEAKTDADGEKVTTTTTANSNTSAGEMDYSVLVTDKDGEYVTDKKGNAVTSMVNAGSLMQDMMDNLGGLDSLTSAASTTTKTTAKTKSNGKSAASQKTTTTTAAEPVNPLSSEEDLLDEGKKISKTTLMTTVVEPVIKSGTFTIDGSIVADSTSIPMTIAFRDSKDYSLTFVYGGLSLRVFSNNGKYYLALPTLGYYTEISADTFEDYSDVTDAFSTKDAKYVQTTQVKDGAVTYTCEEYKTDDGTVMKYYFNANKEWKRMEIIGDDAVVVWKISSFKKSAKSSLFEISKFWKKNDELAGMFA